MPDLIGHLLLRTLPRHHLVHNFALFTSGLTQVNAGRFDMFVPHKVCKQGYVLRTSISKLKECLLALPPLTEQGRMLQKLRNYFLR